MPTILINTSACSNEKKEFDKNFDEEFRRDVNELITKLFIKSNMLDSFSIKYELDDLSNKSNLNNKCICVQLSKLFKNMINENDNVKSDDHNHKKTTSDVNNIMKEIDYIKKNQNEMSNKLDLILEKLNSETSSNNNSMTSAPASNCNSNNNNINNNNNNNNINSNVQLTGAKKRKFNNSNNKINHTGNDYDCNINDLESGNNQNQLDNFNNNSIQNNISSDIEEIDIKTEKSDDYYTNKNINEKFSNSQLSGLNKVQQQIALFSQQQSLSQNQAIEIDVTDLLNEPHIARNLKLDSYIDFKPPIYKQNDQYYVDETPSSVAYSKSKSRRNFAAHLTRLLYTPRERLESNVNGRNGKNKLDTFRLQVIRNTLFKYYPCKQSTLVLDGDTISTGDNDENTVWYRDCLPAIDESNRVLKKQVIAWHKKFISGHSSNNNFSYNQSFNNSLINNNNNNGSSSTSGMANLCLMGDSFSNNNNNNHNNLNYLANENSNNNNYQYDCDDDFDDIYD